jgi:predicted cupin superfamily sugar epimerase
MRMPPTPARQIVQQLCLKPHPEGGWYREIYRSAIEVGGPKGPRAALTTIYYLLERDQVSRWHVVDADEIWHFYGGESLELLTYDPAAGAFKRHLLGSLAEGAELVTVVAAGIWQAARSLGDYSLLGCSVAPGFEFADFRFVSAVAGFERHFANGLKAWEALL